MAEESVEDLRDLREELVVKRRKAAHRVANTSGSLHSTHLDNLVKFHHAIIALDAVIEQDTPNPELTLRP